MDSEEIDKTKHEKILVSYLDINYNNFINELEDLFKYTSEFKYQNVNRIIINLVPDFIKKLNIDNLTKKN